MCGWSFCLRTNLLRPLSNGCEQCLAEAAVGAIDWKTCSGHQSEDNSAARP